LVGVGVGVKLAGGDAVTVTKGRLARGASGKRKRTTRNGMPMAATRLKYTNKNR
jgi:hypothetical protein